MAFLDTRAGSLAAEGGMRPEQVPLTECPVMDEPRQDRIPAGNMLLGRDGE